MCQKIRNQENSGVDLVIYAQEVRGLNLIGAINPELDQSIRNSALAEDPLVNDVINSPISRFLGLILSYHEKK